MVHAHGAILRGAEIPESWHEAIIRLMPKGTVTGNLDAYRPDLGQQDMRMLRATGHENAYDTPHEEVYSSPGS